MPDDYVAKALQDARRFNGTYDQGTSGTLAAHVARFIREREGLLSTIKELEERNAALRAAVKGRNAAAAATPGSELPPDLPGEFLERNKHVTFERAAPQQPAEFKPTLARSTMPAGQLEAAWKAISEKAQAVRGRSEPIATRRIEARPRAGSLIGITGRAGVGKSLAASLVPDATVVQFADPIYAMLSVMLGMDVEQLRDRATKEAAIEWLGKSPRELLQTLGTEWGRDTVRQDIWILLASRRIDQAIEDGDGPVVVADVRFDNEAEMIRSRGGEVWEIVRPGEAASSHSSEAGIHVHLIDRRIDNSGTIGDLRAAVSQAIA